MLENMSGYVGQEMHAERQRQARQDTLTREAASGRALKRAGATTRIVIAKALVALATRIAPPVAMPKASNQALAR
jgi:hypothetical protein